jgi:hypothetical protein
MTAREFLAGHQIAAGDTVSAHDGSVEH